MLYPHDLTNIYFMLEMHLHIQCIAIVYTAILFRF